MHSYSQACSIENRHAPATLLDRVAQIRMWLYLGPLRFILWILRLRTPQPNIAPKHILVYLHGVTDYIYRIHENQDSSENAFEVAIDGARMYKVLMDDSKGKELNIIKNKLAEHWNRNGRQLWNKGQIELAKKCFTKEISAKFTAVSFSRLLRCYAPLFGPKK